MNNTDNPKFREGFCAGLAAAHGIAQRAHQSIESPFNRPLFGWAPSCRERQRRAVSEAIAKIATEIFELATEDAEEVMRLCSLKNG